jgi:type IV secretory pathway VirJ component
MMGFNPVCRLRAGGIPLVLMVLSWFVCMRPAMAEDTLSFGKFGTVHLYKNSDHPRHVVLFVSGDGGWNLGVIDMARALAGTDSLVVGIDITRYLKQLAAGNDKCSYPAADFEMLSQYLQKKYNFANYVLPVLVGYSSGATLVYAVQVQGPPNTFRGAISLGFCPDLPLDRPMCPGRGDLQSGPGPKGKGVSFLPAKGMPAPWVAFQGQADQVCDPGVVDKFVSQTGNASVVRLPKVGHGFSVQKNWIPQFVETFTKLVVTPDDALHQVADDLADLPLIEAPVPHDNDTVAVVVTGDGGWASIDRDLAAALNARGMSVVGLDSLHYFWKRRAPKEMGRDMTRIINHYLTAWHKQKLLLIGYSRGADVLPFMVTRLPKDVVARVSLLALLGVEHTIDFEIRVSDWLPGSTAPTENQVASEVKRLADLKLICIYGEDDTDTICPELHMPGFKVVKMPGGHHFGGDYKKLAEIILSQMR